MYQFNSKNSIKYWETYSNLVVKPADFGDIFTYRECLVFTISCFNLFLLLLALNTVAKIEGVFRTLSNIYDTVFYENN